MDAVPGLPRRLRQDRAARRRPARDEAQHGAPVRRGGDHRARRVGRPPPQRPPAGDARRRHRSTTARRRLRRLSEEELQGQEPRHAPRAPRRGPDGATSCAAARSSGSPVRTSRTGAGAAVTTPAAILTPRAQVVIDWLTSAGWDTTQETGYPFFAGPEILDEPDKAVFITPTGGPGYQTEEAGVDAWSFQARLRGPADDPLGAMAAAQLLDWTILRAPHPVLVDGVPVLNVQRLGSPPSALPLDPSDRRFEYTANYVITTGGGLHGRPVTLLPVNLNALSLTIPAPWLASGTPGYDTGHRARITAWSAPARRADPVHHQRTSSSATPAGPPLGGRDAGPGRAQGGAPGLLPAFDAPSSDDRRVPPPGWLGPFGVQDYTQIDSTAVTTAAPRPATIGLTQPRQGCVASTSRRRPPWSACASSFPRP